MVIVVSSIAHGPVRTMTTMTQRRIFLWLDPIDSGVDKISSKNEREREESRARINRDRSSQEDRERERARLKERKRKWY